MPVNKFSYETLAEISEALASAHSGREVRDVLFTIVPAAIERLIAEQEKTSERLAALEKRFPDIPPMV